MHKTSAGSGFLLCLLIGILVDEVALGIIAGLLFGGAVGAWMARREPGGGVDDAPRD
jgi:hypothetical protein